MSAGGRGIILRKNNQGFTLVETLAVIVIFGMLSAIMFSFFHNTWMNYSNEMAKLSLSQQADQILMIMEEDVLEGESLSLNSGNLVINYPDPLKDDHGVVIFGTGSRGKFPYQTVTYTVIPGTFALQRVTDTGETWLFEGMVDPSTSFLLENDATLMDGLQVTIMLVLFEEVINKNITYTQSKTLIVRNK